MFRPPGGGMPAGAPAVHTDLVTECCAASGCNAALPKVGFPDINQKKRTLRKVPIDYETQGAPRIHGELLKLGIEIAQSSVAKYYGASTRTSVTGLEDLPLQSCATYRSR